MNSENQGNCAGIVLYNPDLDRLDQNINSIRNQIDLIFLIDNNSENITLITQKYNNDAQIHIMKNYENKGIAFALNQICQLAIAFKYEWVLLLDQDSICSSKIIRTYNNYTSDQSVALLTPYIIDINKTNLEEYKSKRLTNFSFVEWAITSGSMIRIDAWKKVGFFDEELFIDAVDFDFSFRLQINGYKQIRINSEYLLQEVGNAEPTWIYRPHIDNSGKWTIKRYYRTNHSLIRQYYMIRNHLIIARKYQKYKSKNRRIIFVIALALPKIFVEKNKFKLVKVMYKGFIDGFKFNVKIYTREEKRNIR
ncbi:glycosyltransferase [Paenibacillus tritici]|uniref:Glycosyltransferase n=1 Tax=Paenibacillus tritici TaxID=1873425 RepID=A0ABX2DMK0_9BACL|nr:glycosyltransferase family 2 protein [Paenibacillus tritici]NQX45866.1 glycosyltransferase [Paenibacillus tritici]